MSHDRTVVPPIYPSDAHEGCRVAFKSDVGVGRDENQDFMGYMRMTGQQVLVVADGMGGHSGGFEASRVAVQAVQEVFGKHGSNRPAPELLQEAVHEAHRKVTQVAESNPSMQGMGTTIVMCLVRQQNVWVAHVGDSRCYHIRGARFTLLTLDHSRVNRMVEAGMVSPEAAVNHPMGHILESCVGGADLPRATVTVSPIHLAKGDRLLLCSDGFWGSVSEEEMATVATEASLIASIEASVSRALLNQTDDNTTLGMLECEDGPQSTPMPKDVRAGMGGRLSAPPPPTKNSALPESHSAGATLMSRKSSRLPWILGFFVAVIFGGLIGGAVVYYWQTSQPSNEPPPVAGSAVVPAKPADTDAAPDVEVKEEARPRERSPIRSKSQRRKPADAAGANTQKIPEDQVKKADPKKVVPAEAEEPTPAEAEEPTPDEAEEPTPDEAEDPAPDEVESPTPAKEENAPGGEPPAPPPPAVAPSGDVDAEDEPKSARERRREERKAGSSDKKDE